ncbi:hypothetical protein [Pseudomonas mandelii]|uniref:Cap15 family cyclic dinucleotide receptor domain-containing protein n=1 Tax=Pseudomonas mandelii TaxID=75612 RepID=UPI003A4C6724
MFSVLSPLKIISFILSAYAVCAGIAVYTVSYFHLSNKEAYSAVAVIATVYDILLLLFVYFAWRKLWKAVPWLSSLLFPDLNGEWEMIIFYQSPENNGVAKARASIRQTFLSISIEVDADGSDSETLSVQQKKILSPADLYFIMSSEWYQKCVTVRVHVHMREPRSSNFLRGVLKNSLVTILRIEILKVITN